MAKQSGLDEQRKEIDITVNYTWNKVLQNTVSPTFSDVSKKYKFSLKLQNGELFLISSNKEPLFIWYIILVMDNKNLQVKSQNEIWILQGKDIRIGQDIRITSNNSNPYNYNYNSTSPELAINCTLIVMKQSFSITSNISKELDMMFKDMKFSDVTLNVQGKEFPAHKVFLTSRSSVFNAMFDNQMKESETNQVFIEDVSHDAFREMLRFIYTGKVENLKVIASELLGVADKYALEELKQMCEGELGPNLSIQNACDILQIADLHNARSLKAKAVAFISNNAKNFIRSANWKSFASRNPRLLQELYQNLADKH